MKKIQEPRVYARWLFLFLVCFCLGILFGNFYGGEESLYYRWSRFPYQTIDTRQFFFYCVKERLPGVVFLLLVGPSFLGIWMVYLSIAWYGFSLGAMLTLAVLRMGIRGLGIGVCAMMPQFLIYIPAAVCLWKLILSYHKYGNGKISRYLICSLCLFAFFLIGTFTEGYGNPIILKFILK